MTQQERAGGAGVSTTEAGTAPAGKHRALLQVERLSKIFPVRTSLFGASRLVRAVDNVSFYIRHAETLGLVGESGCGKTTLGRVVLRLVEPTYGRITFEGRDLTLLSQRQLRPLRRHMQIVFQDPYASLNPRMRVEDIVAEGIRVHNLARGRSGVRDAVARTLESVGIPADAMNRFPHEFSAGERQRIGIARAVAVRPSFLVCDEPVSALDVSVRAQVINLLIDLQQSRRMSYLFISHDLSVVRSLCHRVAVMYLGRIVEMGPTERVFAQPRHPYTRALLSAVPVADPDRHRLRIVLDGEPPSPLDPPEGCAFHPRCWKNDHGECVARIPVLEETESGSHHRVACWHPEA